MPYARDARDRPLGAAPARGAAPPRSSQAYEAHQYHVVYHALHQFCDGDAVVVLPRHPQGPAVHLPRAASPARRSAQTVLWTAWPCDLSPPHGARPVLHRGGDLAGARGARAAGRAGTSTVHAEVFPEPSRCPSRRPSSSRAGSGSLPLREEVAEGARGGAGREDDRQLARGQGRRSRPTPRRWRSCARSATSLRFLLHHERRLAARRRAGPTRSPVTVRRRGRRGTKCERCWNYTDDVGADPEVPGAPARAAPRTCARSWPRRARLMHPILIDFGTHDLPVLGHDAPVPADLRGALRHRRAARVVVVRRARARRSACRPSRSSTSRSTRCSAGLLGAKLTLLLVDLPYYLAHPGGHPRRRSAARACSWAGCRRAPSSFVLYARRQKPAAARPGRRDRRAAGAGAGHRAARLLRRRVLLGGRERTAGARSASPSAVAHAQTGVPLDVPLFPVQLLAGRLRPALAAVLDLAVAAASRVRRGPCSGSYLVLYGTGRGVLEHLRGDAVRGLWLGGAVSTSQLFSAAAVVIGAALLLVGPPPRARAAHEPTAPPPHRPRGRGGRRRLDAFLAATRQRLTALGLEARDRGRVASTVDGRAVAKAGCRSSRARPSRPSLPDPAPSALAARRSP